MAALKCEIELDQFAIDIHVFFKYSAARREDFDQYYCDITDVTVHYVLRHCHCQTRWLSIERVLVRMRRQVELDLDILRTGIGIAERSIVEGNIELSQCLQSQTLDRNKLQKAQSKIEMWVMKRNK